MISILKRVGETPLEALERLRKEQPKLKDAVLSYAGRLDPMAEGEMLVLFGEENNRREEFMHFDKEYLATFLVGVATDSFDALGLIEKEEEVVVSKERIEASLENIRALREQTYPWFSGQTVDGVKLFEHYKKGSRDIVRPTLRVKVKEATFVGTETVSAHDIWNYIQTSVERVTGDFRQQEILMRWNEYFATDHDDMKTITVRFRVSSGTFIRALTEEFDCPVMLLKLNRTKIHVNE